MTEDWDAQGHGRPIAWPLEGVQAPAKAVHFPQRLTSYFHGRPSEAMSQPAVLRRKALPWMRSPYMVPLSAQRAESGDQLFLW